MNRVMWRVVVQAFRHAAPPLAWYYAVTLVIPIANGAAQGVAAFAEHALVVLVLPPLLIVLACAAREVARQICRSRRTAHAAAGELCDRRQQA
jgi:hypothetical protein